MRVKEASTNSDDLHLEYDLEEIDKRVNQLTSSVFSKMWIKLDEHFRDMAIPSLEDKAQRTRLHSLHVDLSKKLMAAGARLSALDRKHGYQALHRAVICGNKELVKLLLQDERVYVPAKSRKNKTALHLAVENGNKELVELLLIHPQANVNAKDRDGRTPLHWVNCCEVLDLMLKNPDIDVNAKDANGNTPLLCMAERSSKEVLQAILMDPDVDINIKNYSEKTALHLAIHSWNTENIKLLMKDKRVDVSAVDKGGRSALHLAFEFSSKEVIDLLLADPRTNDVNATTKYGKTILESLAEWRMYRTRLEILINAGAQFEMIDDTEGQEKFRSGGRELNADGNASMRVVKKMLRTKNARTAFDHVC